MVRALDSVYLSNPDKNIIVPNRPYSIAFLLNSFSHTLFSPKVSEFNLPRNRVTGS